MLLLSLVNFFFKINFKKSFKNTIRGSNGLDSGLDGRPLSALILVQTVYKGYQQTTNRRR